MSASHLAQPIATFSLALSLLAAGPIHAQPAAAPVDDGANQPAAPVDDGANQPAAPVDDGANQAAAHFAAGNQALASGDPSGAIREFEAAHSIRPSPVLFYYLGLAYAQRGEPCVAAQYFRQYLGAMPGAENRGEVEARIAELAPRCLPAPPPAAAPPAAPPTWAGATPQASAAPVTVVPTYPTKRRRNAWKAWVALGVIGTVVTVVVVGVVIARALPASSGSHHHYDFDLTAAPAASEPALIRF